MVHGAVLEYPSEVSWQRVPMSINIAHAELCEVVHLTGVPILCHHLLEVVNVRKIPRHSGQRVSHSTESSARNGASQMFAVVIVN